MADMVSHMDDLADTEVRRRRLIARLVGLRKSNGLTQAAVAESMSVGQSVVAEIESGRTDVRVSTLERYAHAVSLGQLQLELGRDAWVGAPLSGVAETLARYGSAVDAAGFWSPLSLDDLVGEQGTSPIADPADLVLKGVSESDWDDFFATIGIAE